MSITNLGGYSKFLEELKFTRVFAQIAKANSLKWLQISKLCTQDHSG